MTAHSRDASGHERRDHHLAVAVGLDDAGKANAAGRLDTVTGLTTMPALAIASSDRRDDDVRQRLSQ